ncbi:MAG: MarR family transcriptional regulator, partial [Gemmatimonadaceae bacterium]
MTSTSLAGAQPGEKSEEPGPPNSDALTAPALAPPALTPAALTAARTASLTAEQQRALQFWVKLSRAHNAISARASTDVARHGLTIAEFGILEALYHRGPMLLGEVQKRILVSSGGITFLVDRLTAKGLVERRQCDSDRRARYATLTPMGERLVADVFPQHADAIVEAMSGLDAQELDEACRLMRKVGLSAAGGWASEE